MISKGEGIDKIIAHFNSISPLSPSDVSNTADLFSPSAVKKGAYFLEAGGNPDKFGIVITGLFRYFYIDTHGREYTKYFAREKDLLISYSAILCGTASRFYIEALENSEIIVSSYKKFNKLTQSSLSWNIIARKLIEEQYIKKEKREYQFLFDDAETRYKAFLKEYPGFIDRIKHYQIASYLGISPVSLSRIRKKCQKSPLNTC